MEPLLLFLRILDSNQTHLPQGAEVAMVVMMVVVMMTTEAPLTL
jgi:hypothetical protein